MEAAGLRTVAEERQAQVDAVLGRFFSLAKKRVGALGPEDVELWNELELNTIAISSVAGRPASRATTVTEPGGRLPAMRMPSSLWSLLGGVDRRHRLSQQGESAP